jgi:hypothetical protein
MGAVDIVILIGSSLLAIGGVIKIIKPDYRFRGGTLPCGASMIILGVGLALKAIGL